MSSKKYLIMRGWECELPSTLFYGSLEEVTILYTVNMPVRSDLDQYYETSHSPQRRRHWGEDDFEAAHERIWTKVHQKDYF